jgi:quinol monooxygenase YgiN
MTVYTLGLWQVKAEDEHAFVSAWRDLASKTKADFPQGSAVLLRDREVPGLFISAGPWESIEQIERWRASATFAAGVAQIKPHLESFEPHTLDVVVSITA